MILQTNTLFSWEEALHLQMAGFWLLPCLMIAALYLFWEKLLALSSATHLPTKLLENIKPLIRIGDKATSIKLCNNHRTPAAKLLATGVSKLGKPFKEIYDTMQQATLLQMNELENRLGYLILFSEILPAFGLLLVLIQTQFLSLPFQFAHLLPLWLGWAFGFLGNVGYNILVMRLRATKHTLDKTMQLWLMFLQEN